MTSGENSEEMGAKVLFFFALLSFSALSASAENEEDPGLVMNFYKDTCPQAEEIIREQVKLLYKRHKNTAFSWLRNIFHDCAVQVNLYTVFFHFLLYYILVLDSYSLQLACICFVLLFFFRVVM